MKGNLNGYIRDYGGKMGIAVSEYGHGASAVSYTHLEGIKQKVHGWSHHDSADLYGLDDWGNGYFRISKKGEVTVRLNDEDGGCLLYTSLKQEPSVRAAPVAWRRKWNAGQWTAIRVAARHVYRSGYSCFPGGEFLVL